MPFKVKPVPSVCVKVVSVSAPKPKTAESVINVRSSPMKASAATPIPQPKMAEPVVALEEAVVLLTLR